MSKLRKSARGRECQVRVPGVCNGDSSTVVLAHISGGGMGAKRSDIHGAYCCSSCHDAVDGRAPCVGASPFELHLYHLEGVVRTQEIMLREGLIKLG